MNSPHSKHDEPASAAAIFYVFAACLSFGFLDASFKYLGMHGVAAPLATWMRFAMHVAIVFIFFRGWLNLGQFRTKRIGLQVLRGLFLYGSTLFNVLALHTLQLAEVMAISFFSPMLITALAGPLLGEWAGWRRWMAVLAGFVGVVVITRPGVSPPDWGHLFALASTTSYSFYIIMTRRMGAVETPQSLILYSALAPVILTAPLLPEAFAWPETPLIGAVLLGLGIFGALGHWFLIRAYRMASTTSLAPYPYVQMVWAILFGWLFFDQLPDSWTMLGAAVIVTSGLYIVHREHRLRLAMRTSPGADAETLAKRL